MMAERSMRGRIEQWLHDRPDDAVLRWLFGTLLSATVAVLALDYMDIRAHEADPSLAPQAAPTLPGETTPFLPGLPGKSNDGALRAKMSFDLVGDGRLMATGTIEPGTADTFAAEVGKRGAYVKTVVLHSPGGSVTDALAMGRLIRKSGFATEVEGVCASSCPLVFAGGTERRAGDKAMIGVHQVFALSPTGTTLGMDSGQRVSAECQKYLREMGIDLEVWVHAMETPKEQLYRFKPDELLALKLATQRGSGKSATADARAKS
jgi:hypothetical protein